MKKELTNEEVDARLIGGGIHPLRTSEIEEVRGEMYRQSQYATFQEAYAHGAFRYMDVCTGYTAACDALYSMEQIANLLEYNAAEDDICIILEVDGKKLPECFLSDAVREINRYLVRSQSN